MNNLQRFESFVRVTGKTSTNGGAVLTFVDGPYCGVEFAINRVSLKENVLDFHYDVMSPHKLWKNPNFEKELGDLVVYLLENPDIKIGYNVQSANSNSPESNS